MKIYLLFILKICIFAKSKLQNVMNKTEISERIARLREELRREHLSAFIFPTSDPHNSEYTAEHWKGRAGTAVVTLDNAALWTDSRYFIAAEEQLQGTEFQLMKLKVEGTPSIAEWLGRELKDAADKAVGIDGMVNSTNSIKELISDLRSVSVRLCAKNMQTEC